MPALKQLVLLLKKRLEALDRKELRETDYKDPSWSSLQAHRNGARQQLQELLDLLFFVESKN